MPRNWSPARSGDVPGTVRPAPAGALIGASMMGDEYDERLADDLMADGAPHPGAASLIDYVAATTPGYEAAWHHREIAHRLEQVSRGEVTRLMITVPPRHGKSAVASARFPCWYLARHPSESIIAASYGASLAGQFGRMTRNTMLSAEHRRIFDARKGAGIAADSQAVMLWHTEAGGTYLAAGVGGAITGAGANILLIDDPVKSREEADSPNMRERVMEWYRNDAYSRLMPNADGLPGRIVLIQTRWHEEDLAGQLLAKAKKGGDAWEVLHYPAIIGEGTDAERALWPERYSLDVLKQIRDAVGPRTWSALYQGDPAPDTGLYFHREWLRSEGAPPRRGDLYVVMGSDYAVSEDSGDYTVHVVMGIDRESRPWVLDVWRGRTDTKAWADELIRLMKRWAPAVCYEERGSILRSVGPFIAERMANAGVRTRREQLTPIAEKTARARNLQGWAETRGIWFDPLANWANALRREFLSFPAGADDQVDACALVARAVHLHAAGPRLASDDADVRPNGEPEGMTLNRLWKEHDREQELAADAW